MGITKTIENTDTLKSKIKALKNGSGTHSPSIATLISEIPGIEIKVDACFLSNPYATELFMKYLNNDLIHSGDLRGVLEYYPPQNRDVSRYISKAVGVDADKIFVGNGAAEIIQAVLHKFVKKKICVIIPTFSSYYEFVEPTKEVVYYQLQKENNFNLDLDDYLSFLNQYKPDTIVIINPNNPDGGYLSKEKLIYLLKGLKHVDNIVIDESFIHFAYEDVDLSQTTSEGLADSYPNLIIVKSMSKDFGIAGIRAGYAIMSKNKIDALLKNGFLWNVSGLADYFFKRYGDVEFIQSYDIVRKKYIMNTLMFLSELNSIPGLKVYPSKANFALVELLNGINSFDFTIELLTNYGIYVRDCSDKLGLEGEFVRIASRTFEENIVIIDAIKKIMTDQV